MLVGFQLFRALEPKYECIEVFPQAAFRALDRTVLHKSRSEGLTRQVELLGRFAGIDRDQILEASRGPMHDRVDAVMSA